MPVFFRDDDAGWGDDRLSALLDLFAARGVPVDVAVIPAELHAGLAGELAARARAGGVRLHQHGFPHVNHEPSGRKHEFGPTRRAAEQCADVAAGPVSAARRVRRAGRPGVHPAVEPLHRRHRGRAGQPGMRVLSRDAHGSADSVRPGCWRCR